MTYDTFCKIIAKRRRGRWAYLEHRFARDTWRTSRSLRSLYRTHVRLNVSEDVA